MTGAFWAIVSADIGLAFKHGGRSWMAIGFFLVVVALFPFGIGPEPMLLTRISAGVVWVAALLSALLSLDVIFGSDQEDGTLDLLCLSPIPMAAVVGAKALAHWVVTGLPIVVAAPFMGIMINMPEAAMLPFMLTVFIGTPALSFIGAVGAALAVSLRRGGVLVALLVLPLYIPTLIFGTSVVDALLHGGEVGGGLLFLAAVSVFAVALGPLAGAAAIHAARG